jgi:diadenosine tetraphosphate (Ap4A) HIT family hydrolase
MSCVFCERLERDQVRASNELAAAFAGRLPLTPGHTLVVPRRHEPDYLRLTDDEHAAIWRLVASVRALLDGVHRPQAYNLGVNVGATAGQTVDHAYLHIMPRYAGDVPEPRGGIRWIIPAKAAYWQREA